MPPRRRTPDELLLEAQAEERAATRGYLKIFLGYASGVGKTHRMVDEARRRRARGQDVVIGGLQPNLPADVAPLLQTLEVVRPDVDTLLQRHPGVCFIDGLAYDNPPGARNPTRWQDVENLLDAGIKVVGSINIQYVAELREEVSAITGKHVTQTVPLAFIQAADEIEIVDAPPAASGDLEERLLRLRELALVLAADVVERQLDRLGSDAPHTAHERILVCITPRANVQRMMEAASIVAGRFHAELLAAYVCQPEISAADNVLLEQKLAMARAAGATVEILHGPDPVTAILDFAHSRGVTQLFIGHTQRTGLRARLWASPVDRLIRDSSGMDVRVFPQ